MKNYTICQSCSIPLKKDENLRGTNADGSKNNMFCLHCYENGNFINSEMKVNEMQLLVKNKMKQMGFPGFLAGLFTKGIPNLIRWK